MREHGWPRYGAALIGVTALLLGAATPVGAATTTPATVVPRHAPSGDAFYTPHDVPAGRPGEVIWTAPIISPARSRAWKILYHSQALDGRDIAVSGIVIAPTTKAPPGGRPVITWAHGTHGLADACAPSKALDIAYRLPGIRDFIAQGDVVVATDYEGFGTSGEHPYLVGASEGRGVLDIARAAQQIPTVAASSNVVVYGHSQGGQAALFAGEIAPSYAPDLHLLGVVALAPVSDVTALLPASNVPTMLGYVVMAAVGFHAAYPTLNLSSVLTPMTLANLKVVDEKCSDDVVDYFSQFTSNQVIAANPVDAPGFAPVIAADTAGNTTTPVPLLVVQGDRDTLVPQQVTDRYVQRACAHHDQVLYRIYPGSGHLAVRGASLKDVEAWIAARFAGQPATSTC